MWSKSAERGFMDLIIMKSVLLWFICNEGMWCCWKAVVILFQILKKDDLFFFFFFNDSLNKWMTDCHIHHLSIVNSWRLTVWDWERLILQTFSLWSKISIIFCAKRLNSSNCDLLPFFKKRKLLFFNYFLKGTLLKKTFSWLLN